MKIKSVETFDKILASYAPYGIMGITKDCGVLCETCMEKEKNLIVQAIKDGFDEQWLVTHIETCDIDPNETFCDHCGKDVSAYKENN